MSHHLQETKGIYRFSIFRLDVTERCLWADKEQISLTPKQFDLLVYFVENAGYVMKKSQLLDAIWADAYVEEATLARNISWLRSKLEEHTNGESLIETVPKRGYRFTAEVARVADKNNDPVRAEQTAQTFPDQETIELADSTSEENDEQVNRNEEREQPSRITPNVPSRRHPLSTFAILCLIVIVCVAFAGSGYMLSQDAPKADTQTPKTGTPTSAVRVNATITIKNIAVDATQQATDAGIKVLPGDIVMVGAEGLHQPDTGQNWTLEGDKGAKVSGNQAFQQADPWSLVGWIGTTEADRTNYFQVSKTNPITSNKSGVLYLAINDWQQEYANNRGGLLVTVTLTRTFDISAETDDAQGAWGNGLVELHKEDTLAVTAAGTVSYWLGGELYDPNGSHHKLDGLLAPAINTRSLIGKIGSRNPFKLGMNYPPQRVGANGCLFISVNDQITRRGAFKNNSGNISVGIEVVRSPEIFTNPI
ncbi:MAG: winged helix-turn-helix domain-containing protein [Blastocatellia bacterium]|nr:winged helix-turn-helix domain-containing protein [Blastocatellia bacterium]